MLTNESTITVSSMFGKDQQLTMAEYTKRWTDHVNEMRKIDYSDAWQIQVDQIERDVTARCENEFILTHNAQQAKD